MCGQSLGRAGDRHMRDGAVRGDTAWVRTIRNHRRPCCSLRPAMAPRQTISTVSSTVRSACTTPFVSAWRTMTKPSPS